MFHQLVDAEVDFIAELELAQDMLAIEMHLRLPKEITLEQAHTHATAIERRLRDTFGSGTHIMLHIEPTKG